VAKLVIYEEVEDTETIFEDFELSVNRILIGSGQDNHLVLDVPEIDPAHVSLELRHDHWILQDLGGPGGTLVNHKAIDGPYHLQHNDLIELGGVKLRFQEDDFEEAETEEVATEEESSDDEEHISGRVWFATVAGGTLAAIFIILLLLIIADYLGLLKIADLLPPWLGWSY
jgi:pSer/pThr/pTyr-binding forkhead associated (FHA) protein